MCVALDNCYTNDAMIRDLILKLGSKLLANGDLFHVRCSTHIVNLVVQEGIDIIKDVLAKVRDSVKYVKSSTLRLQTFKEDSSQIKAKYHMLYSQQPAKEMIAEHNNLRREIAKAFIKNTDTDIVLKKDLENIRDATARFDTIDPKLLPILSSKNEVINSLINTSLIQKVIQNIQDTDVIAFAETEKSLQEHDPLISFVICCQGLLVCSLFSVQSVSFARSCVPSVLKLA